MTTKKMALYLDGTTTEASMSRKNRPVARSSRPGYQVLASVKVLTGACGAKVLIEVAQAAA